MLYELKTSAIWHRYWNLNSCSQTSNTSLLVVDVHLFSQTNFRQVFMTIYDLRDTHILSSISHRSNHLVKRYEVFAITR